MTTIHEIQKIVCRGCYAVLDVGDNFCRHCGLPTRDVPACSVVPDRSDRGIRWTERRWVVLASLFLLLGPLALPMLWRSRRFSPVWKITLTTLVLGLTTAVLWLIWHVVCKALEPLRQLGELERF